MSNSKVMRNTGTGPRLRQFVTFKDLKHEKKKKTSVNRENSTV